MAKTAWRMAALALSASALALVCGCVPVAGQNNSNNNGTPIEVSIGPGSVFVPASVTAAPGDTVRWTSVTTSRHTVTSDTPMFDSDDEFPTGMVSGGVYEWQVPADVAVGTTVFYHCRFHATPGDGTELGTGMVGSVQISDWRDLTLGED